MKPRKFGCHVRTYVRTYARIRPGNEFFVLPLSLIFSLTWSPSYPKSDTKTYSVRLKLIYLSQKSVKTLHYFSFFFSCYKNDLDISFQLKRSDCMKRRQICGKSGTLLTFKLNERGEQSCWKT